MRARAFCRPPNHRVQRTNASQSRSRSRSLQPSFVHSEPGGAARAGRVRCARQHPRRHGSRFIRGAIAVGLTGRRPELVLEVAPLRSGPTIRSGNPGGGARVDPTVGEASRQWIFVYILSGIIVTAAFGFYLRDLGRKSGVRWFCVWSFLFQQDGLTAPEVDVGWRKIEIYKPGEKIGGQTRGLRVVSTQRTGGIRIILWDERRRRLFSFREMHTATSMTGGMKLREIRQ